MIKLKTDQEIEIMKEGGAILASVVKELIPQISEGMTTKEVDAKAEELIIRHGAQASFKTVPGYSWATCLPVNAQAVHTPPTKYCLQSGDILTVDIGVYYKGYHTDYATTLPIGEIKDQKIKQFLKVGKETLDQAIDKVKEGEHLGTIAQYIETIINNNGYFILKDLTGHGIGKKLHEDPYVYNYVDRPIEKTYRIRNGLTIAVEIIYSMGSEEIAYEKNDNWSIISKDSSLSACFEKTIAIQEGKTFILT
ncbi:type I methionyl aminopeptidase [soil metagenome]